MAQFMSSPHQTNECMSGLCKQLRMACIYVYCSAATSFGHSNYTRSKARNLMKKEGSLCQQISLWCQQYWSQWEKHTKTQNNYIACLQKKKEHTSEHMLTTDVYINMLFIPWFHLGKWFCWQCNCNLISRICPGLPRLVTILSALSKTSVVNLLCEVRSFIYWRRFFIRSHTI